MEIKGLLKKIDPKKNGNKFSPNLHDWIRRHTSFAVGANVYHTLYSPADGTEIPFNPDNPLTGHLMIGTLHEDGWGSGNRLGAILCGHYKGRNSVPTWAYSPKTMEGAVDVSDWFWSGYLEMGRGVLDPNGSGLFQNDDGRFEEINAVHRKDTWTGRIHRKIVEEIVDRRYRVSWHPA